jgi:uncharacterized protein YdhG (YjbR/CyaY superfamily)
MTDKQRSAKPAAAARAGYEGFTDEERAAMKDHAEDLKRAARHGSRTDKAAQAAEDESAVLAKIGEMNDSDRAIAERLHALIKDRVPDIAPKLWYGMPAYARDGKTICFFQPAQKFKSRYATLGFNDSAKLDEDSMWPVYYALAELTAANEARIAELIKRAVS